MLLLNTVAVEDVSTNTGQLGGGVNLTVLNRCLMLVVVAVMTGNLFEEQWSLAKC